MIQNADDAGATIIQFFVDAIGTMVLIHWWIRSSKHVRDQHSFLLTMLCSLRRTGKAYRSHSRALRLMIPLRLDDLESDLTLFITLLVRSFVNYHIAGNFQGVHFSRTGDLLTFHASNFANACYREPIHTIQRCLFYGSIFHDSWINHENYKIGPLENVPQYSSSNCLRLKLWCNQIKLITG